MFRRLVAVLVVVVVKVVALAAIPTVVVVVGVVVVVVATKKVVGEGVVAVVVVVVVVVVPGKKFALLSKTFYEHVCNISVPWSTYNTFVRSAQYLHGTRNKNATRGSWHYY